MLDEFKATVIEYNSQIREYLWNFLSNNHLVQRNEVHVQKPLKMALCLAQNLSVSSHTEKRPNLE